MDTRPLDAKERPSVSNVRCLAQLSHWFVLVVKSLTQAMLFWPGCLDSVDWGLDSVDAKERHSITHRMKSCSSLTAVQVVTDERERSRHTCSTCTSDRDTTWRGRGSPQSAWRPCPPHPSRRAQGCMRRSAPTNVGLSSTPCILASSYWSRQHHLGFSVVHGQIPRR